MLHLNDITYRIGGRLLFEEATAAIPEGHRVGLFGRNGAGKSTLLRLITGEIAPASGEVRLPKRASLTLVAQEAPDGPASILETVLAAHEERSTLMKRAEAAEDAHEIAEVHTRLADIDAHSAPARAATILAGLGFDEDAQQRACSTFSGGWRMRVALAAALFAEPDLLLLDEPTNYLDVEGTMWLEGFLARYPRTVVIVSHDRSLLTKAVNAILHLENRKLSLFRGNFDRFEKARREQQALQLAMKKKQEDQRRHMEAFVERFRYKASKARQAQSRLKALAKMEPIPDIVSERVAPFLLPNPEKQMAPPLVRFDEASVGYGGDKPVLSRLNLRIDPDDRIALLGANGNGKSTFAKLLTGRLQAEAGRMLISKKAGRGYFAQHQMDELPPGKTPYELFRDKMPDATQAEVRARAGAAGFGTDKADTTVAKLSGGEKARLLLSLIAFDGPHLIVLDEPTNHLDMESREALVQALNEFEGAVVLISHDRHLIETSADRLWLVAEGTVTPFDGDIDDYARLVVERDRTAPAQGSEAATAKGSKKEERRAAADRRKALQPLKRGIETAEKRMAEARGAIATLDRALAEPGLYESTPERAAALAKERADAEAALERAEEDWLAKSAALEEAKAP